MAETNQDFITYQGDDVSPIFTVLDADGVAVNISAVTEITWTCRRNLESAALLTKTKTLGDITFVTDGTDGKFQVEIIAADTTPLTGFYLHTASITDSLGAITTVTVGRMQVGQAPAWSYDPTALSTALYQARMLIGDTMIGDQLLSDAEVNFCLSLYPNVYLGAAECARNIAMKFARQVDISQGELQTSYSQRSVRYGQIAKELESRGSARGGVALGIYAGGISVQDKIIQQQNPDRVRPQFNLGMWDNLLVPVPPVADPENEPSVPTSGVGP